MLKWNQLPWYLGIALILPLVHKFPKAWTSGCINTAQRATTLLIIFFFSLLFYFYSFLIIWWELLKQVSKGLNIWLHKYCTTCNNILDNFFSSHYYFIFIFLFFSIWWHFFNKFPKAWTSGCKNTATILLIKMTTRAENKRHACKDQGGYFLGRTHQV